MPNHCNNTLHISGDRETLADFVQRTILDETERKVRKQHYDILAKLYPIPQELVDTVSGFSADEETQAKREIQYENNRVKYGYKDWYDWANVNWGTKWGDYETYLDSGSPDDKFLEFRFDSAWSPPIEGIAHIATMFPTLNFIIAYEEGGMGFFGVCTFDSDGTYSDTCMEMEDIPGWSDLDFDTEEYDVYERMNELVYEAMDSLRESVGI